MHLTLKESGLELPREKALRLGVSALTDEELLAVILRTGTKEESVLGLADKVLHLSPVYDGLVGLMQYSLEDLQSIKGVGETKAIELQVVGELAKRIWNRKIREEVLSFRSPGSVLQYFKEELRHLPHEEVHVLYLDTKAQLLKDFLLSKGRSNASILSGREIFMEALRAASVCFILVHNHPSGDPHPSKEDERATEEIYKAGEYLGIHLMDHIIIGDNQYYSFKEQGKI